jgi:hypothetical protein
MSKLTVIPLLLTVACGGGEPTFAELQADVLTPSCAFSSCHGGGAGGLTLGGTDDYAALVGAPSKVVDGEVLVVAGDSGASYLMKKLEGSAGIEGEPMPPPSGGLDPDAIEQLRAWIDAGAPE